MFWPLTIAITGLCKQMSCMVVPNINTAHHSKIILRNYLTCFQVIMEMYSFEWQKIEMKLVEFKKLQVKVKQKWRLFDGVPRKCMKLCTNGTSYDLACKVIIQNIRVHAVKSRAFVRGRWGYITHFLEMLPIDFYIINKLTFSLSSAQYPSSPPPPNVFTHISANACS